MGAQFDYSERLLRDQELADPLKPRRLQRAIGVIYRPESERSSGV